MSAELNERERIIIDRLSADGSISVGSLARDLGLSEVTIRGDLRELEDKGWINRKRGGATASIHKVILERQRLFPERKNAIARAAAKLVKDGDVIMIEAGTTTALIARYLSDKQDIHIVTNSTLVFSYARMYPNLQITMTGGEFHRSTESMVGPITLETIERVNVRFAFVGTDGFSIERGMTTHLIEGAEIVKAMKTRAQTTVLVADSSKYGRFGFINVLPLSAMDLILTDSDLEEKTESELNEEGINIKRI
ncbi:MAG: DeoR/GlpR family DNA-binding transcription regulator [Treponema sp.]|jgi:DeoR family galactitol utilization operon repressor|nr:DeoR/GlpR family DNA-binding transcription regulator [Treponema sp.]